MSTSQYTGRFLESLAPGDPRAADARAAILGVPYDGAVTYRGGASGGPEGLRRASESIENYCPKLDRSIDEFLYVDLGDLRCEVPAEGEVPGATPGERLVRSLRLQLDALPDLPLVAIGGDHLVAHPFLARAVERYPNLQIIHVDAHMDLRPDWEGEPFNHSTVLGRILDQMGPDHRLHQWGIRSGERREYALARGDARVELLPQQDLQPMLDRIVELMALNLPIYVTIDVDGIDPADLPGTGTPEPDGLRFGWVEAALDKLATAATSGPGLVGADLVELAPDLDPTGRSSVAAARLIRTLLLALVRPRG
ncbi:MAG TPA: agmatinase [Enhygromyxa sp.]|nr:agmatinase [Enhygromyxa sp.]